MTVLITRPLGDGIILQNKLEELGIHSIVEPMLNISIYEPDTNLNLEKTDALVFTSKNAVSHIKLYDISSIKNKTCFAIGPITKFALNNLGFTNVQQADNHIANLISDLASTLRPSSHILYFRGKDIKHNLKNLLQEKKMICSEKICYEMTATESFSKSTLDTIQKGEIKAVLLYSYNTAKIFFKLCDHYNIANCFKESKIIAVGASLYNELQRANKENVVLFKGDITTLPELMKSHCVI